MVDVTSLAVITRVEVIVVVVLVVLRPPAVMEACEMVSFTQSTIGMMEQLAVTVVVPLVALADNVIVVVAIAEDGRRHLQA